MKLRLPFTGNGGRTYLAATGWQKMFALINQKKWDKLRKLLHSRNASLYCLGADRTGLTVLSFAIGSRAPLDVVELLLAAHPAASTQNDNFGALPVHVACLNGASALVVKRLIEHDNCKTLYVPDHDGRLPLHHAVEFSARLGTLQSDSGEIPPSRHRVPVQNPHALPNALPPHQNPYSNGTGSTNNIESEISRSTLYSFEDDLEVIRTLCRIAPDTVHYHNKNNDTPLDVAHVIRMIADSERNKKRIMLVYEILRSTSINLYKEQKKKCEAEGFIIPAEEKGDSPHMAVAPSLVASSNGTPSRCEESVSASASASASVSVSQNDLSPFMQGLSLDGQARSMWRRS